jgi:hypothetical protein
MDLSKLIPKEDTFTIEVKHPVTDDVLVKDDGKVMTITVYLPHSAQYKAVVHEQTQKRIHKMAKGKKGLSFTPEEFEQMSLDLVTKTVKDWNIQIDGKSPKFSEAAARDLFVQLPWLKDQITDAQGDLEAYLGN